MNLRLGALGAAPKQLPNDLTGHAINLDLSHIDAAQGAAAAELIKTLLDRGAARLVISGADDHVTRELAETAKGTLPSRTAA